MTLCKTNTGTTFCEINILFSIWFFFVDLNLYEKFETITMVLLKIHIFCEVTPFRLLSSPWKFRRIVGPPSSGSGRWRYFNPSKFLWIPAEDTASHPQTLESWINMAYKKDAVQFYSSGSSQITTLYLIRTNCNAEVSFNIAYMHVIISFNFWPWVST